MDRKLEQLRNIGVIAHIDAGKTTVTERMLFYSGAKHRVGQVDKGTTETDDDAEEQERGISIYSACVTFPWNDVVINLIDTPGHVDFTAEVERCLRVLDGGVVVFSAREGVEAQSETVWRQADKYGVPRIAFINKMDREGADFERTFGEIRHRLAARPVAIQIPAGQGPPHSPDPFRGVVDLVSMELVTFDHQTEGQRIVRQPIPPGIGAEAELWRETMLERLYEHSDQLMELALQEKPIPAELIHRVLRDAVLHQQLQPVLCGSALHGIGVQPLLDAVARYLPSPADVPPVVGTHPSDASRVERRRADAREPFCGLVFKILPAKTGDLYWVRIYSGQLKANSRVYNPRKDKKENVSQLWHIHVTKRDREGQVPQADAGDIVGLIGPRFSVTGDTLCDANKPIVLESIQFPEAVISMAIEPETSTERQKLTETLQMMNRQDPTFHSDENHDTGQTIISGMGELHLEVIKHRLLRDFRLKVKVHKPRVNYRESIQRAAETTGECNRQIGGQQLFARVTIRLEPQPQDRRVNEIVDAAATDAPARRWLEAARQELESRLAGGGILAGFPLMRVKLTILAVESRPESSNETAFRIAAADAFERALAQAGPVLLEPVMRLEVSTPDECLGDFVGDLQQRRATIVRSEARDKYAIIEAHAPLAELFGYSSAMRSLSQGRATSSIEPHDYAPAPPDVVKAFAL
jgi:elongation factor G